MHESTPPFKVAVHTNSANQTEASSGWSSSWPTITQWSFKVGWGIALGLIPRRGEKSILKYFRSEVETEKISRYSPSVYPAWGWPICMGCPSDACCSDADAPLEAGNWRGVEGHPHSVRNRITVNTASAKDGRRHLATIERGRQRRLPKICRQWLREEAIAGRESHATRLRWVGIRREEPRPANFE